MQPAQKQFIHIDPQDASKYFRLFDTFPVFQNYLNYVFEYITPEIWVDSPETPAAACLHTPPAYLFTGDPKMVDVPAFFAKIPANSWLLFSAPDWEQLALDIFGERLEVRPRTQFSSAALTLDLLQTLKKPLPEHLELLPIGEKQTGDQESILSRNLLKSYFVNANFMQRGYGFCVMDGEMMAAYAATNFPMRDGVLEVDLRTANEDRYRQKGLGMAVSIALVEYCLQNGIDPHWDAANEISAHMAKKLGYTVDKKWNMYHLI